MAAIAQLAISGEGCVHRRLCSQLASPASARVGWPGQTGLFVAMEVGEVLEELDAAAMAVHVAEAADVHQDVEAEALTGAEAAQELVVASAMLCAEVDQLGYARGAERGDVAAELAVGEVAVRIEERCGQLDLEGLVVVEQVDDWSWIDGLALHQLGCGGGEFACGFRTGSRWVLRT